MMRSAMIRVSIRGVAFAALACTGTAQAAAPVVQLTDASGTVEYSRDGERWRPVARAKYLFEGYRVRTGADSSAVIVNEYTGRVRRLAADSLISVDAQGATLVQGDLLPGPGMIASQN